MTRLDRLHAEAVALAGELDAYMGRCRDPWGLARTAFRLGHVLIEIYVLSREQSRETRLS